MKEVERRLCFYCGGVAPKTGKGDHFPVPFRHGGTETVNCCTSCHDMKDRIPFDRWPLGWFETVLSDFPLFKRETKLFFAKAMYIITDAQEVLDLYRKDQDASKPNTK